MEYIFSKLTIAHLDEAVKIIEGAKQQMLREGNPLSGRDGWKRGNKKRKKKKHHFKLLK